MKNKFFIITFIISAATFLYGCGNQTKTKEYLALHSDEMQIEANNCINMAKKNIDIRKNETCMNIVAVEMERCNQEMQKSGNMFGIDCENGPQMMGLAAKGF